MKKMTALGAALIIIAATGCASINDKSLKKPIPPAATIAVAFYTIGDEKNFDNITAIRKFMQAGYKVKALNTVRAESIFPSLKSTMNKRIELKGNGSDFKGMAVVTEFTSELNLKKELQDLKKDLDIDYLLVLYYAANTKTHHAVGIDLSSYDIVYTHSYTAGSAERAVDTFIMSVNPPAIDKFIDMSSSEKTPEEIAKDLGIARETAAIWKAEFGTDIKTKNQQKRDRYVELMVLNEKQDKIMAILKITSPVFESWNKEYAEKVAAIRTDDKTLEAIKKKPADIIEEPKKVNDVKQPDNKKPAARKK